MTLISESLALYDGIGLVRIIRILYTRLQYRFEFPPSSNQKKKKNIAPSINHHLRIQSPWQRRRITFDILRKRIPYVFQLKASVRSPPLFNSKSSILPPRFLSRASDVGFDKRFAFVIDTLGQDNVLQLIQ
jgi:hypothetical protein